MKIAQSVDECFRTTIGRDQSSHISRNEEAVFPDTFFVGFVSGVLQAAYAVGIRIPVTALNRILHSKSLIQILRLEVPHKPRVRAIQIRSLSRLV